MISIRDARSIVLRESHVLGDVQGVPVVDAVGRRLAADVASDGDLPPFDRVMMDGFAVRAADLGDGGVVLPVTREVAAGASGNVEVRPGEVHSIMTGAPLPPGADAVIQIEWTEPADAGVRLLRPVTPGQNVARRGEDLAAGDRVARAGELVTTMGLSLLIASGVGEVPCLRRPRVAVLTSGDELVPPGAPVRRGQIRESNGPALASLFRSCGAEVLDLGVTRDTRPALSAKLEQALAADVVVLTGGSSVGKYDHSAEVVESFGAERHFDRVAVKPGKPTLFYTRGSTLVFCLPGNPVAALMTGRVLVCAAVQRLAGAAVDTWPADEQPLLSEVPRNPKRDLLIPVRRSDAGVQFDGWHGSADLVSMGRADAFAYVERGEGAAPVGTRAPVFPLPGELAW